MNKLEKQLIGKFLALVYSTPGAWTKYLFPPQEELITALVRGVEPAIDKQIESLPWLSTETVNAIGAIFAKIESNPKRCDQLSHDQIMKKLEAAGLEKVNMNDIYIYFKYLDLYPKVLYLLWNGRSQVWFDKMTDKDGPLQDIPVY